MKVHISGAHFVVPGDYTPEKKSLKVMLLDEEFPASTILGILGVHLKFRGCRRVCYMDVSKNRGTPIWMVKIMENPIRMEDLRVPLFSETPTCFHIFVLDSSFINFF